MAIKSVRDCHTAQDFERAVRKQGGEIVHGRRHDQVRIGGHRPVAIPRHKGNLPKGTECSIRKALLAAGFFILICACGAVPALNALGMLP